MTKKDYVRFAEFFLSQQSRFVSRKAFHLATYDFACMLLQDNANFRFTDWCEALAKGEKVHHQLLWSDLDVCVDFCLVCGAKEKK